jgi:hypothetical protein
MKTLKSPKGNELPLTNLKGKDYLMVAYRLQWLNEACETDGNSFSIDTEIVNATDEQATVKSTVTVRDKEYRVLKSATGTKTESKKDFGDFLEKAETGSIGRALAMIGFGTQFALADLDEGDRIVDSPVIDVKQAMEPAKEAPSNGKPSFRKPPKEVIKVETSTPTGWE